MEEITQTDSNWEFNAPQYIDFRSNKDDDDDVESYFDVDHENGIVAEYPDPSTEDDIWDSKQKGNSNIAQSKEVGETASEKPAEKSENAKEKPCCLVNEDPQTPGPNQRRLTRSMCATPVNDKGLPEATELNSHEDDKNAEDQEEYHSAASSPVAASSLEKRSQSASIVTSKVPSNIHCGSLEEWRKKTSGCKPVYGHENRKDGDVTGKSNLVKTKSHPRSTRSMDTKPSLESVGHKVEKVVTNIPLKRTQSTDKLRSRSSARQRTQSVEGVQQTSRGRSMKTPNALTAAKTVKSQERRSVSNLPMKRADSVEKLSTPVTRSKSLKRVHSSECLQDETRNAKSARLKRSGSVRSLDRSTSQRDRSGSTTSVKSNTSAGEVESAAYKMPKLTLPSTPSFMKRKPLMKSSDVKSAEEKELEEIAHMRKELAKKRKIAQKSYEMTKKTTSYVPTHSRKEPTMPMDVQFSTDARIKSQTIVQSEKSTDFVRSLRSSSKEPPPVSVSKGLTKPEPFVLHESRKRKEESTSQKTMAEHVQAFHKQTPERFRSKVMAPPQRCARGRSPGKLTIPKTPQFETRSRTRPVHVPSHQELEEQELEEMKKHQIKANPVNHRILTESCIGVKKVAPKPCTQPEEFNLHHKPHTVDKSSEEDKFEFHANPCPKKILEGPVGVKPPKEIPLTHPQSPAFALKHRVRMPIEPAEEKKINVSVSKRPVAHHGIPYQPVLRHKTTVPQPFGFADRDKVKKAQKEAKLEQYLEDEQKAREFHAQPLPDFEAHLPARHPKPLTKPEPFDLKVDKRGAKRQDEWNSKLAEEEEMQKQKSMFRARPAIVTQKEPYRPQQSTKPLTDITEFTLSTEQRSHQREDFEMFKKSKEAEIEAQKRQRELMKEEEEKQIIAKLRKQAVHQANPVRRFKPVEVVPSDKPLTAPATPHFQTDRRLRSRLQS